MPLIQLDRHDRVAVITLNDPGRRNTLSTELCAELAATLDELEADPGTGAIVVTGAAPAFCAGADLSQLGESRKEGLLAIYEGFLRVASSPLPTVAAVNGAAVGAGMNLALACDVRIAGRAARFDTRFLDLGIHPGGGHTWMLRRIVGQQDALAMVLFGQVLDADEARRVGLTWATVDDDALLEHCVEFAARAGDAPPELARRLKRTVADMATIDEHSDAVERELTDQLWSMDQPEFAAKLAALQQRITKSR